MTLISIKEIIHQGLLGVAPMPLVFILGKLKNKLNWAKYQVSPYVLIILLRTIWGTWKGIFLANYAKKGHNLHYLLMTF